MESHIEQEESDSSRQSADLRIRKTQVEKNECLNVICHVYLCRILFLISLI